MKLFLLICNRLRRISYRFFNYRLFKAIWRGTEYAIMVSNMASKKVLANKRLLVSFDLDGILTDSASAVIQKFNKDNGTLYTVKDIDDWHSIMHWSKKLGHSDPEKYSNSLWNDQKTLIKSGLMPASFLLSYWLYKHGIRHHVITSRPCELRKCTLSWVRTNLPWIDLATHVHIRDNNSVTGEDFKAQKINELGIEIHVDDSIHQVAFILDKTKAKVLLVPLGSVKNTLPKNDRLTCIKERNLMGVLKLFSRTIVDK